MKSNFDVFSIFREQAKGHLQTMIEQLLVLEKGHQVEEAIRILMRACHTLKGAARAINLIQIKNLAHTWEDIFSQIQKDERVLNMHEFDQVFQSINNVQNQLQKVSFQELMESPVLVGFLDKMKLISSSKWELESKENTFENREIAQEHKENSSENKENAFESKENAFENKEIVPEHKEVEVQKKTFLESKAKNPELFPISSSFLDSIQQSSNEFKVFQQATVKLIEQFNICMDNILKLGTHINELGFCEHKNEIADTTKKMRNSYKVLYSDFDNGINHLNYLANQIRFSSDKFDEQVVNSRLKTLNEVFEQLPLMVRNLAIEYDKEIEIKMDGREIKIDSSILDTIRTPLTQLLRNAIAHGIETPQSRLSLGKTSKGEIGIYAREEEGKILIDVEDDGSGIDIEKIREKIIKRGDINIVVAQKLSQEELFPFLFLPGFTTSNEVTSLSGRGVGLDIVKSKVESIGGSVTINTEKGKYTRFTLNFPIRISLTPVLLFVGGIHSNFHKQIYAIPQQQLATIHSIRESNIVSQETRKMLEIEGTLVPAATLSSLFFLSPCPNSDEKKAILIKNNNQTVALIVEEILYQENVIVKPISSKIGSFQDVRGIATLATGKNILVLDPTDLIQTITEATDSFSSLKEETTIENKSSLLLVVEDSATVRELIKRILIKNNYKVITAVDGQDGLNKFQQNNVDVIITDIDMPRSNGFEMIESIRNSRKMPDIPIIILSYKEQPEYRSIAARFNVQEYLTKADFDHGVLLEVLKKIVE